MTDQLAARNTAAILRGFRAWLDAEHVKAVRADQARECPPDLRISPHNGIAAGLAIALHGIDRILENHFAGPSVREAAEADPRWDLERLGE